jgi:hypothetical protein
MVAGIELTRTGSSRTTACTGALAALLAQSLMDFNPQIPTNAFLFPWIAGTGTALLREEHYRPRHREVITLGKDQAVLVPDSSVESSIELDAGS